MSTTPAAGWYDDPEDPSRQRWWDGQQWGTQRREPPTPPPPPPPPSVSSSSSNAAADPATAAADKRLEHALVPTNRSGLAIAAGYLGLVSVILLPAPIALVVGLLALRDLNRRPHLLGRGRAWFGTIMGAVFTLAFVLLAVTGGPDFSP